MWRETYRTLFMCISFNTSKYSWFVESRWVNQDNVKTTGLDKQHLAVGKDLGTIITAAAIAGSTIGIGMTSLPHELSSPKLNPLYKYDISVISETKNGLAIFGMENEPSSLDEAKTQSLVLKEGFVPTNEGIQDQSHIVEGDVSILDSPNKTSGINSDNDLNIEASNNELDFPTPANFKNSDHLLDILNTNEENSAHDDDAEAKTLTEEIDGTELTSLIPEHGDNHGKCIQWRKINLNIGNTKNEQHMKIPTENEDIKMAPKRRNLRLLLKFGACSLLVITAVVTVIILRQTIMNKDQMIPEIDTTTKKLDITTQGTDITTEGTNTTTEWIDIKTEEINATAESKLDATAESKLDATAKPEVDAEPEPELDAKPEAKVEGSYEICREHKNIQAVCSKSEQEQINCQEKMSKCMNETSAEGKVKLLENCSLSMNEISITKYLSDKFEERLNQQMQISRNISSLNCTTTFDGFETTIREMSSTYNCQSDGNLSAIETKILGTCNTIKGNPNEITKLCLTKEYFMQFEAEKDFLNNDMMGWIGTSGQAVYVYCTFLHDQEYSLKHFWSN